MLIKICGMTRQEDVDAAIELGADLCGFVFHPKSKRNITPDAVARIETGKLRRIGVFVDQKADEIKAIMARARLDYAQLHGPHDLECAKAIGPERVIRVVWPARHGDRQALIDHLQAWAEACAMFALDSGFAGGGSGQVQDWSLLEGLRPPRPWLLAGGLNAGNVGQAIASCQPDGVEFNSGIEYDGGKKDREKMAAAIAAVKASQNNG